MGTPSFLDYKMDNDPCSLLFSIVMTKTLAKNKGQRISSGSGYDSRVHHEGEGLVLQVAHPRAVVLGERYLDIANSD